MSLADFQPDILFQGDTLARERHLLACNIRWAAEQIRCVARTSYLTDVSGREAHLEWMKQMGAFIKHQRRELAKLKDIEG